MKKDRDQKIYSIRFFKVITHLLQHILDDSGLQILLTPHTWSHAESLRHSLKRYLSTYQKLLGFHCSLLIQICSSECQCQVSQLYLLAHYSFLDWKNKVLPVLPINVNLKIIIIILVLVTNQHFIPRTSSMACFCSSGADDELGQMNTVSFQHAPLVMSLISMAAVQ